MSTVGFYHIGQLHCWKEVNEEILNAVKNCGLLDKLDKLYLGIVGYTDEFELPFQSNKIEIVYTSPNLREFEYATTQLVANHAKNNPNDQILHFHNSGVKQGKKIPTEYVDAKYPWWRWWEVYHTIHRWQECLELLKAHDACGIEIQLDPFPHFSGTWWWANAEYINTLISVEESKKYTPAGYTTDNSCIIENMHGAEFWIGLSSRQPKWASLSQTGYHWLQRQEAIENVVKPELKILNGYWND